MDRGSISWVDGWALVNDGGHAQLQQVFVWENGYADNFDYWGGGILNTGVVKIVGSTVTGNSGNGGIRNDGGAVEIFGSVVAENYGGGPSDPGPYDCKGPISDLGYNVFGLGQAGLCMVPDPASTAAEPMLSYDSYPEVGSYYHTARPGPGLGSPAIDRVPLERCAPTDGLGRPRTDGSGDGTVACDAGALEYQGPVGTMVTFKTSPLSREYGEVDLAEDSALYVFVLSTEGFDPADVVASSVSLVGSDVPALGGTRRDWNGDGVLDLRVRFRLDQLSHACGRQEIGVTAMSTAGELLTGELKLDVIGCTS